MDCIIIGLRYGLIGISSVVTFLIGMIVLVPILNAITSFASKFTEDNSGDDGMSEK